jgi:threonine synthase
MTGAGLWRYLDWLPVAEPLSLGEPTTPLVEYGDVLLKLEGALPTGSFKDRGAAVQVAALRECGVTHVVEDSSGNAGAALAAYCARAGIACDIYVPASAPPAKLAAIRAYGARLIPVDGPRSNCTAAAERAGGVYASHARDPMYLEGTKTFAFELWEQLGGVPDTVVFPVGGGALLLGADKGFRELLDAGRIDRLPRLIAAQAEACAPLVHGLGTVTPRPSLADGILIPDPVRGQAILDAMADAVAVGEDEIRAAHESLARSGVLVELTSAVAVAALAKIDLSGTVVVAATGNGLKTVGLPSRR